MTDLRLAVIGPGKMGTAVAQLAREGGAEVVAVIGPDTPIDRARLSGAQVAIDFTDPSCAVDNAKACVIAACPVVVGTTGWNDRLEELSAFVLEHDGTLLWSANFSVGVHALAALLRSAGTIFAQLPGFDAHLVETHHAQKKDAPSGTAIMLGKEFAATWGHELPVASIRVGSVPGTHELILDGAFEQIVVRHEARDRRVFAEGALVAARWLVGRKGVFTMADVVRIGEEQ